MEQFPLLRDCLLIKEITNTPDVIFLNFSHNFMSSWSIRLEEIPPVHCTYNVILNLCP